MSMRRLAVMVMRRIERERRIVVCARADDDRNPAARERGHVSRPTDQPQ